MIPSSSCWSSAFRSAPSRAWFSASRHAAGSTLLQQRHRALEGELRLALGPADQAASPSQRTPAPAASAHRRAHRRAAAGAGGRSAPAGGLRPDHPGHSPAAGRGTSGLRGDARAPAGRSGSAAWRWRSAAIFLVRYSIEQNLLSPATRIALGGLFALALIGAGEWLRRRERSVVLPGLPERERARAS